MRLKWAPPTPRGMEGTHVGFCETEKREGGECILVFSLEKEKVRPTFKRCRAHHVKVFVEGI